MPNVGITSSGAVGGPSWIAHVSRQRLIPAKNQHGRPQGAQCGERSWNTHISCPGNCATASRQCLGHQEWECTRYDTEMLLRGRETQQAHHSGSTGLLGESGTHQPWVPEYNKLRHSRSSEWHKPKSSHIQRGERERDSIVGVAGPMLIGFPPPPQLGTHGMSKVDSNNATCNAWNCIPDELPTQGKPGALVRSTWNIGWALVRSTWNISGWATLWVCAVGWTRAHNTTRQTIGHRTHWERPVMQSTSGARAMRLTETGGT